MLMRHQVSGVKKVPQFDLGITRAKAKIKAAGIPHRVPCAEDLPERVSGVPADLYLSSTRAIW
jgi:predicted RNA polymerase sigma factor